jgi:hypothetical protein
MEAAPIEARKLRRETLISPPWYDACTSFAHILPLTGNSGPPGDGAPGAAGRAVLLASRFFSLRNHPTSAAGFPIRRNQAGWIAPLSDQLQASLRCPDSVVEIRANRDGQTCAPRNNFQVLSPTSCLPESGIASISLWTSRAVPRRQRGNATHGQWDFD